MNAPSVKVSRNCWRTFDARSDLSRIQPDLACPHMRVQVIAARPAAAKRPLNSVLSYLERRRVNFPQIDRGVHKAVLFRMANINAQVPGIRFDVFVAFNSGYAKVPSIESDFQTAVARHLDHGCVIFGCFHAHGSFFGICIDSEMRFLLLPLRFADDYKFVAHTRFNPVVAGTEFQLQYLPWQKLQLQSAVVDFTPTQSYRKKKRECPETFHSYPPGAHQPLTGGLRTRAT